ncbi:MAG: TolC family protein [Alistipes sp.]|jgi:outer membrane protein TolC|nr:TolC family protein [Alistipes sp.]
MRRFVLLLLAAGWTAATQAQETQTHDVTIEDCYAWTRSNYPLVEQLELIGRAEAYNLSNAARGWLPQVGVTAQASYQSDVTRIPLDPARLEPLGIEIPTLSRDQYNARIELGQTVWDGGAAAATRKGVGAAAEVERASTEVSLYALRERVNGLFFGILVAGEQIARLDILARDLDTMLSRVEALVEGGLATGADADAIRVEQLKAQQQQTQLAATRRAYTAMLSTLTGRAMGPGTRFVTPSPAMPAAGGPGVAENRPEMALFDAQIESIQARQLRLDAAISPRVGLFATGGYGRPALDMLADRFEPYYIVGARLSWNIGGLYTRRNDRRQIALDRRGVELRRNAFLVNTNLDATLRSSDIDRLREQLRFDDQIVALRESVLRSSEAKISNGTLSGSDLARDINALEAARQDKLLHEMELLMAVYNLKFTTNN